MIKAVSVRGPYWDRTDKRWSLRWTDEAGRKHAPTFDTKDEAKAAKRELTDDAQGEGKFPVKELRRFTGSASEFKAAICSAVKALNECARSGNGEGLNVGKKYVSALRDCSEAMLPHAGYMELEREMEELTAYVEDVNAGKAVDDAAKPAALRDPRSTLKGSAGSDQSLRRPGDPVSN